MLPSIIELDAFCLDYFEKTHARFGLAMEREHKVTLLLQHEELGDVLARLREHDGEAVARHEGAAAVR